MSALSGLGNGDGCSSPDQVLHPWAPFLVTISSPLLSLLGRTAGLALHCHACPILPSTSCSPFIGLCEPCLLQGVLQAPWSCARCYPVVSPSSKLSRAALGLLLCIPCPLWARYPNTYELGLLPHSPPLSLTGTCPSMAPNFCGLFLWKNKIPKCGRQHPISPDAHRFLGPVGLRPSCQTLASKSPVLLWDTLGARGRSLVFALSVVIRSLSRKEGV
jgi:hypothetical protein